MAQSNAAGRDNGQGGGSVAAVAAGRVGASVSGSDASLSMAGLATLTGVVALMLFAAQQGLRMPSGFGIEDVLGWSSAVSVQAAIFVWCQDRMGWQLAVVKLWENEDSVVWENPHLRA